VRVSGLAVIVQILWELLLGQAKIDAIRLPIVRRAITRARYQGFARRAGMRTPTFQVLPDERGLTTEAIRHNMDPKWMFYPGFADRPDLITRPLSVLSSVRQNGHRMRVLICGARTEAEALGFMSVGFSERNITSCDLFSYTPTIELANLVALPYRENQFDIVVLGWVLEFITDIDSAVSETLRVLAPDGLVAVGAMYHPESEARDAHAHREVGQDRVWNPRSTTEILAEFGATRDHAYFLGDVAPPDRDKRLDLVTIFRNPKADCE
jgi:SAM-dependent methyltransferase